MAATAQRTHVVLASDLVAEIDRLVGKRRRSEFIAEAAGRELARQRQIHALRRASGAWRDGRHPEVRGGSALHVRRLREENERRISRLGARS